MYSQFANQGVLKVIELDVDGVIADIHNALNKYVSTEFNIDFNGERDICSWGMKELDHDVRKFILGKFSCPRFITDLGCIDGSIDALVMLDIMAKQIGATLKLNTNVNKECVDARKEWLQGLLKETGVDATCIVDSNLHKIMLEDSCVVIDDHAENIRNSKAKYKFLVRRGHNRNITLEDLTNSNTNATTDDSEVFIVKHLWDVIGILESKLQN